jgi:hypothetical protein
VLCDPRRYPLEAAKGISEDARGLDLLAVA